MKLESYEKMVIYYQNKHGLNSYKFLIDREYYLHMLGCIGLTKKEQKEIILDYSFIINNNRKWVRDVLLHEIAHALDPREGVTDYNIAHDKIFNMNCFRVGAVWQTHMIDKILEQYDHYEYLLKCKYVPSMY